MRFRFTLSNIIIGSLVLDKNPEGWDKMQLTIKRGPETHGLFYEQAVNLRFFCKGAGKEYIDTIREEQGIDAVIGINIDIACHDCEPGVVAPDYSIDYSDDYGSESEGTCNWDEFYEGILDMKTWSSDDTYTNVNIIQSGLLQKIRNRMDTKVDLLSTESIEGTPLVPFDFGPYPVHLHSKVIREIGDFNYSFLQSDIAPAGLTEAGTTADTYAIPVNITESTRTIEDSFSQTLIPDLQNISEIPGYNFPSNNLIHSATYPGDASQIQGDSFYDILYNSENTIAIRGKIRFGINAYLNFPSVSVLNPLNYTFVQDILNPTFYISIAGIIVYSQSYSNISSSKTYDLPLFGPPTDKVLLDFFEFTAEFDLTGLVINPADQIKVYFKYNSHKVFDRPGGLLDSYSTEVKMYSFIKEQYSDDEKSFIYLVSESITAPTTGYAFAIFEAGARIAQVITDELDPFRSDYFGRTDSSPKEYDTDGCGSKRGIMNGFGIRGYPITGDYARTIRMSLTEYFQGLNSIDNLGLGVEKEGDEYKVVINRKEYFYDKDTVLLTLSNVPNLVISEAPEYYYARINVGYSKWQTEFTNGLDEFNSTRKYETGIRAIEGELNIISELCASGYRIEAARRKQFIDTGTEDTEFDEDNFVVCLRKEDINYTETNENFTQVNNVISPETSYNLDITPARNYLRNNNIINSGLTKYPGRLVKMMSGEGNYKITSEYADNDCPGSWSNELLSEGQSIQWDDVNNTDKDPLWLPETASFKFPVSYTQLKTIMNNPKGVIMVSDTNTGHKPYFILEVSSIPANGGLSDFKLLRAFE